MMANRERGEVSRVIGGTSYTFVLDMAAMIAAETEASRQAGSDVTWDQFWTQILKGSARALAILIWAMLRRHHSDLTPAQVVDLIDESGGVEGLKAVIEQGQRSTQPDPEDMKELGGTPKRGRPRKAQAAGGTGGRSSDPADVSV